MSALIDIPRAFYTTRPYFVQPPEKKATVSEYDVAPSRDKSLWDKEEITEIRFGDTIYPLRESVTARLMPGETNFMFRSEEFPSITGAGSTPEESRENWKYEFHTQFQNVYTKLHWELSESDKKLLDRFVYYIDVQTHLAKTPVSFEQTGKIIANRNLPSHKREIEWMDDTRNVVDCGECPHELQQWMAGQYFRASILRDYNTGSLVKILAISETVYEDKAYSDEELDAFVNSLPTSKELPISKVWN